jgi:hypothetical protein
VVEGGEFCSTCGTKVNIILQEDNMETESFADDEEPIQKSSRALENEIENEIQNEIENEIENPDQVIIYNCLPPQYDIAYYSDISLKNEDKIKIIKQELFFYPFYIIDFDLNDTYTIPYENRHYYKKFGKYYVDAMTKKILSYSDSPVRVDSKITEEQSQIVSDLTKYESVEKLSIKKITESEDIKQLPQTQSQQDIELYVKKDIIKENKKSFEYLEKKLQKRMVLKFTPNINSITITNTQLVYVPKLEIEFDSFGRFYRRVILPVSGKFLLDEIGNCNSLKHTFGKKENYAVCEECGIAKCEDHILMDEKNMYFCKDHASEELIESKKGPSLKEKLGRFSFMKK